MLRAFIGLTDEDAPPDAEDQGHTERGRLHAPLPTGGRALEVTFKVKCVYQPSK